ncbi:hypothetical protein [Streptomyces apocyni]|uniref:hypothetical protein n=1 Tax=Streptomyces apocyni TaxID=2654677 RepID=UPI0012EA3705|nr:hypothetical protein [Streptomyces apocyni]
MRTRITTAAAIAVLAIALVGCSSETDPESAASDIPTLSAEDKAKAREAAGLPPEPDAATTDAYIKALNAISPDIVDGKIDKAVSRGLNQCSSIKSSPDDREKLAQLALDRFTISTRLPDLNTPDTGGKVLDAVHKHLCPDF